MEREPDTASWAMIPETGDPMLPELEEQADAIADFVEELLERMGIDAIAEPTTHRGHVYVDIVDGPEDDMALRSGGMARRSMRSRSWLGPRWTAPGRPHPRAGRRGGLPEAAEERLIEQAKRSPSG